MLRLVLTVLWVASATTAVVLGWPYYRLPLAERAYSDLAAWYAPTGLVGQGLGILGSAMMLVGMVGYSARKRIGLLARAGALGHWLQVHIFLCTLGPFFVLLHTTFKFGGLVAIAFWSMAVVVASGIFGRYVYVRIPKARDGRFLGSGALEGEASRALEEISRRTELPPERLRELLDARSDRPPGGPFRALWWALRQDADARRKARDLERRLVAAGVGGETLAQVRSLLHSRARLRQQAVLLDPFHRLFRYWHVIHLPLATVMVLILAVHVGVAVAFGYTWIF